MSVSSSESFIDATDGRAVRRRDNAKRLFDAAMRLAQQKGYQSVTADDICREAGVGRATFFRIYKSKAGLLREFNRRLASEIEALVEQSDGSAIEKLSIVADEIAKAWQRGGAVLAAMVTDYISSSAQGASHWVHQEIYNLVVSIVSEGIKKGELRDSLKAEQLASLMLHQVNIAIVDAAAISGEGKTEEANLQALAEKVLEYFFNGAIQK